MVRRAQTEWQLIVILAIFAVVTVLTVLILIKIGRGANDTFNDRETCRLSVLAHKSLLFQLAGQTLVDVIDIDCRRRIVTVTKDHIEVNGEPAAFYDGKRNATVSNYPVLDGDTLNAITTDELAGCWYQFLQGKTDFLGENTFDWEDNNRRCFVCSELQFAPGSVPLPKKPEPLINYLETAKVRPAFVLEQDGPRNAKKYLFNDDAICGHYYYDWTDTSYFGLRDTIIDEHSTCPERYITFWSPAGTLGLGKFIGQFRSTSDALHNIRPFLDRDIMIAPQTNRDHYVVVFMAEGGSWWHKTLYKESDTLSKMSGSRWLHFSAVLNPAFAGLDQMAFVAKLFNRVPSADNNGVSTYAAWVFPADQLNSEVCNAGYFA